MASVLNIQKMIADCGGAGTVASRLRVARTLPYGWVRRGHISSRILMRFVDEFGLRVEDYIERTEEAVTSPTA